LSRRAGSFNIARVSRATQAYLESISSHPRPPDTFVGSYHHVLAAANERQSQQERLLREFHEPSVVGQLRVSESELVEPSRILVDQRRSAELLRESPQLAQRRRLLHQIHEMCFNAAFGEKPQCLAGIGAFLDSKNLNFQSKALDEE